MNEQRKLRNLLAYTKTDTIEELEDCNKLYQELLDYINKSEKEKKVTRNEAMKELEKLADYYGNDIEDWKIGKYIIQQEKVTELLELYKKLLKYIGLHNTSTYCSKETIKDLKQKVKDTQKEIENLEKELGK